MSVLSITCKKCVFLLIFIYFAHLFLGSCCKWNVLEARKKCRRLFVEVWENKRHCAKPSTQRCLDLRPVSDKLLNFAGEEKEKDEEKLYHFQILKYIQFAISSLVLQCLILNENNFEAEGYEVQVNVSQDGRSRLLLLHGDPEACSNLIPPQSQWIQVGKLFISFFE